MTQEKEYLVKYRFINTGSNGHDVIRHPVDDKRTIEQIIEDRWRGLLCTSGGLRSIVSITELKE